VLCERFEVIYKRCISDRRQPSIRTVALPSLYITLTRICKDNDDDKNYRLPPSPVLLETMRESREGRGGQGREGLSLRPGYRYVRLKW
jgi:hypothetical protein